MPSQARIGLDVDDSGLRSDFDHILDDWQGHREAMLTALAEDIVGKLKLEIAQEATDTGLMGSTTRAVETSSRRREIVVGGEKGVDYVLPVLKGTDPHPPGSSDPTENRSLARWARRNNYPGGFDGIYWSIARYGTEPHDFVSGPLREARAEASGVAAQVLRNRGVLR